MVEKILDRLLLTITDPFMLFALLIIFGLFYLLIKRDESMKIIFAALKEHSEGLSECNKSICGLVPLIEVLVYGKGGKRL